MWIKVEDELPWSRVDVTVRNGMRTVHHVIYYKGKWKTEYENHNFFCDPDVDDDEEYLVRELHKVTHWWKDPISYPKIPLKDMDAYLKRAKKYRKQIHTKRFKSKQFDLGLGSVIFAEYNDPS